MVTKHAEVIDLLQLLVMAENQVKENLVIKAKTMKEIAINNLWALREELQRLE